MASLKELITLTESNYNYECDDCGSTFGCGYDRISAMDKCEGDEICEQENGCKECKSTNIVEVNENGKKITEACKRKKKSKKEKKSEESDELVENRLDALETILEMVEEGVLTTDETLELETSIESIFNNVLEESQETDYDEYYDEGDDYYECTECDWEGLELDLDEDGDCPECGSEVEEIPESEDDHLELNEAKVIVDKNDIEEILDTIESAISDGEDGCFGNSEVDANFITKMVNKYGVTTEAAEAIADYATENLTDQDGDECQNSDDIYSDLVSDIDYFLTRNKITEGMTLKKTTSRQRAKAKRYRNSVAGKKAMKLNLKKRKKYSDRIAACAGKGKTFSMKKKTCVKSKKRR